MNLLKTHRSGRQTDVLIPVSGEGIRMSLEQGNLEEGLTLCSIDGWYGSKHCHAITRDSTVKAQQYETGQQIMHCYPISPYAVTYGDGACTTHLMGRALIPDRADWRTDSHSADIPPYNQ